MVRSFIDLVFAFMEEKNLGEGSAAEVNLPIAGF